MRSLDGRPYNGARCRVADVEIINTDVNSQVRYPMTYYVGVEQKDMILWQ
jgi:hypothetical protein